MSVITIKTETAVAALCATATGIEETLCAIKHS